MKYDICHASKDFIREARLMIDSLVYSETKALKNEACDSVFSSFYSLMLPILKTGEEMTECFLFLSSYEPLIAIAEETESKLLSARHSFEEVKKHCGSSDTDNGADLFLKKSKNIIQRLLDDLISAEISERLCCDYLSYMICLLESMIRLCGCASEYEKCTEALSLEASFEMGCREPVHSMKGLLSLIK